MDPKLQRLFDRIEVLIQERAELGRALASGRASELPLQRLYYTHRELTRPDTFFELREAWEGASAELRERLTAVCLFLVELAEDAHAAEAHEQLATWEGTFSPWRDQPGVSVLDALRELPREPVRARRVILSQSLQRELQDQDRAYARAIEARFVVAERLGFDGPPALRALFEPPPEPLLTECEQFLARTEDAYLDLLGYAIRRLEPSLKHPLTSAERSDLERACHAPWTFGELTRGVVTDAVRRFIEQWGIAAGAGRVEVDDADRPGKPPSPVVTPVRVPQAVHLAVRVDAGVTDALALLRGDGEALAWALRASSLPVDQRRLAKPELASTFATLFGRVACDALWLERYLRVTRGQARELARLFAFAEVTRLRAACGQVAFEQWLSRNGLTSETRDAYEGELRRALRVSIPRGEALRSAQRPQATLRLLRGSRLGGVLPTALRDRFDEDYWRNPAASALLREAAARPPLASEVFSRLGLDADKATLSDGASELLKTMGA